MPVTLTQGQRPTVTLALVVAGLVLELVDADLGPLVCASTSPVTATLARSSALAVTLAPSTTQGDGQRYRRARLGLELLDLDHVTDGDLVLLAAGLDDCVMSPSCPLLRLCGGRALPVGAARVLGGGVPACHRLWTTGLGDNAVG